MVLTNQITAQPCFWVLIGEFDSKKMYMIPAERRVPRAALWPCDAVTGAIGANVRIVSSYSQSPICTYSSLCCIYIHEHRYHR